MNKILEAKDLSKTYVINKRQNHVLKNVSLSVNKGEFVSVMGPSGSGKSTLLYNISGMDKMTSGEVIFKDTAINELDEKELSKLRLKNMGFVFQQINLLKNLGIVDNIILSAYMAKEENRDEINERAFDLMKKTGIIELADNDITQASGGQLQRVAICRALINNPDILFGDEPTGALDSKSTKDVMDIFHKINREGTTIMLVTHDVKVASQTEKVFFIKDGNINGEHYLGKYEDKDLHKRESRLGNWLFDMGF